MVLMVSSGIVANLAKSVSLQIRAQIDMGNQCTPSLITTLPEWFWVGRGFCSQFHVGLSMNPIARMARLKDVGIR